MHGGVRAGMEHNMNQRKKKVRLADIAEEVGVSIVTVSNALQGRKGVSDELRKKIEDQAVKMGYQVKEKRLDTVKVGILILKGYVMDQQKYYLELYQRLVTELTKRNGIALLEILQYQQQGDPIEMLNNSEVDGFIVIGEISDPFTEDLLSRTSKSVVFMDYYRNIPNADFVMTDGYFGGYTITRYLLDKGIRDLMYVGTPNASCSITDRYMGFRKALFEAGVEYDPSMVIPDREIGSQMASVILPDRMPEGFVCNCDATAAILIDQLSEHGYRVPEDVSVVGYDNFNMQNKEDLQITTYAVDRREYAKAVVDVLFKRMQGIRTRHSYSYRIQEGTVIEGDTVKGV